jgi:prepilin-type N-terminal cleavage/methylation domain-containing protein
MHMYHSSTTSQARRRDDGFTLIEILIAIVLIGILSAVAVVGISNLVSKGTSSSCGASKDAANAASAVYFAGNSNAYPTSFTQLTSTTNGAAFTLPTSATINSVTSVSPAIPTGVAAGLQVTSGSWYLTMTVVGGGAAPTFACN